MIKNLINQQKNREDSNHQRGTHEVLVILIFLQLIILIVSPCFGNFKKVSGSSLV